MLKQEAMIGKTFQGYTLKVELATTPTCWIYLGEKETNSEQKASATFSYMHAFPIQEQAAQIRFSEQMHLLQQLQHAHIVPILLYGFDQDIPYQATPFAPQRTLQSILRRRGAFSQTKALSLITQIGEALHIAHQHGIVHGHLSLHTVLLKPDGDALLTDFSTLLLEKLGNASPATTNEITEESLSLAPEQWKGIPLPASDQYALGYLASTLLMGYPPLLLQTAHQKMEEPHAFYLTRTSTVQQVMMKAMANNPEERYPSVTAFLEALRIAIQREQEHPTSAVPTFPLSLAGISPLSPSKPSTLITRELTPLPALAVPDALETPRLPLQTTSFVKPNFLGKQPQEKSFSVQQGQQSVPRLAFLLARKNGKSTRWSRLFLIVIALAIGCIVSLLFIRPFAQKTLGPSSSARSRATLVVTYPRQQTPEASSSGSSGATPQPTSLPTPLHPSPSSSSHPSTPTPTSPPIPTPTPKAAPSGGDTFEDGGLDGWSSGGHILNMANSSAYAHDGAHSLMVALYSSSPSDLPYVYVPISSGEPRTGEQFTAYLYLPANPVNVSAKLYVQDSKYQWYSSSTSSLAHAQWVELSLTIPSVSGSLNALGVQFLVSPANTDATVYLDSVNW